MKQLCLQLPFSLLRPFPGGGLSYAVENTADCAALVPDGGEGKGEEALLQPVPVGAA